MQRIFSRNALCVIAAASALWAGAASAQSAGSQTYNKKPIAFFIAKGAPDSCGKGCSEWIAAEGTFDAEASKRFENFLAQINRRDLPVFFNSRGGNGAEGIEIGYLLRRNRMAASVGITSLAACKGRNIADDKCWRQLSGSLHHDSAKLHFANALCGSACVFALVGASVRRVPPGVIVAVHATKLLDNSSTKADADDQLRAYFSAVGVDPALVAFSERISHANMHRLSPAEIKRFNIVPNAYETPWMGAIYENTRFIIFKGLTEMDQNGPRHTALQVACENGVIHFQFRRESAADGEVITTATVVGDDTRIPFWLLPNQTGVQGGNRVDLEQLDRLGKLSSIKFTEQYSEPGASGTLDFSMTGFAAEVAKLRKRCRGLPAS